MDKVVESEGSIDGEDGDVALTAPQKCRGTIWIRFLATRMYLDSDDPSALLRAFFLDSEGDIAKFDPSF